jgi:hypothetical protein
LEEQVFMNHAFRCTMGMALAVLTCLASDLVLAQPAARPSAARPAAAAPAVSTSGALLSPVSPYRRLAPGVMQDVIADRKADDTIEKHDVTELLYVDPTFDFAKNVSFRHVVWTLDFKYKPVRMIYADIPGPDGRMQRKQVWYIVYEVTNSGKSYRTEEYDDKLYEGHTLYQLVTEDKPVRFAPVFTLEVHNELRKEVEGSAKGHVEQAIPIVLPAIRAREDKNREFLTSEQMALKELRAGETVWGVATWQDVDPRNVWFSVYVEGLTNAYQFEDDPAKYAAFRNKTSTEPFREIRSKVLKLNFWRPGDERVNETQVRTGVPQLPGGPPVKPASEWVWWKTFPPAAKPVPPAK